MKSYLRLLWGIALLGAAPARLRRIGRRCWRFRPGVSCCRTRAGRMDRIAGRRSLDFGGVASDSAGVADDRTRLGRSRETSGPAARRTERGFCTARCLVYFDAAGAFAGGCGYAGSDPRDSRTTRIAGSQYHRVSDGRIGFRTARSRALPAGGVVYGRGRGGADAHPGFDESRRGKGP